jgi:hypothetical protein
MGDVMQIANLFDMCPSVVWMEVAALLDVSSTSTVNLWTLEVKNDCENEMSFVMSKSLQ